MTEFNYSGVCRGGPWDGHNIERDCKEFSSIWNGLSYAPTVIGYYEHVLGQWIWHPTEECWQ